MKHILAIIIIAVLIGTSCTVAETSTKPTTKAKAELVYEDRYSGYLMYTITRVWINGLPYLVNSNGGIVLEASELEYGTLVDRIKEQQK